MSHGDNVRLCAQTAPLCFSPRRGRQSAMGKQKQSGIDFFTWLMIMVQITLVSLGISALRYTTAAEATATRCVIAGGDPDTCEADL